MKLSIVVPFYNEEKNILFVLEEYKRFEHNYDFELVCVNNGSRDHSDQIFCDVKKSGRYPFAKVITVENNRGYGYGIIQGVKNAVGEVIAWTHADLQTDSEDVFCAFDKYSQHNNEHILVKGNRVKRPFLQAVFSFGMAVIASIVLNGVFFEINAQPKLFHRSFLPFLRHAPDDFSLDLYLLYQAKQHKYSIRTIDVIFRKRLHGTSKWAYSLSSRIRTIARTIRYIFKLRNFL